MRMASASDSEAEWPLVREVSEVTKQQTEREEAIESLKKYIKPGDTVYTILRNVSRSGMTRHISVLVRTDDVTYLVADALDYTRANDGGLKVSGAGMDMGFDVVYGLSYALYPSYPCTSTERYPDKAQGCPSNTHVNSGPDRDKYGHGVVHTDGYALKHRWL